MSYKQINCKKILSRDLLYILSWIGLGYNINLRWEETEESASPQKNNYFASNLNKEDSQEEPGRVPSLL